MKTKKTREEIVNQIIELAEKHYNELKKSVDKVTENVCDAQVAMQATYDTTRQEQSWLHDGLNKRLSEIRDFIYDFTISSKSQESMIGTIFNIEIDGEENDYVLVSKGCPIDLSPLNLRAISIASPLGKCLLEIKDQYTFVDYTTPDGEKISVWINEIYR